MKKYIKKILFIVLVIIILFFANFIRNYIIFNKTNRLSNELFSNLTNEKIIVESSFGEKYLRTEFSAKDYLLGDKQYSIFETENNKLLFNILAFTIFGNEDGCYKIKYLGYKNEKDVIRFTSYAYINKKTGMLEKISSSNFSTKYTIEK